EWKSTGKWVINGDSAALQYQTMKGKSFEDYRAEYKKDEEGGGQISIQRAVFYDELYDELGKMNALWIDEDKKRLDFSPPAAEPPPAQSGDLGALAEMLKKGKTRLERMGPKKE